MMGVTRSNNLTGNNPPSSDDESSEESFIEDYDVCSPIELDQYFQQKFVVHHEMGATLKKEYVLSLGKDDSFTRLAVGLSDGSVHLFDTGSERGLCYSSPDFIKPPESIDSRKGLSICGVRFMDETPNLLLVGTTNQLIRLFDLRVPGEVSRFNSNSTYQAETSYIPNKFICFDRNSNSRVLCVGTEEHNNKVLLLFYDLRKRKELGAYIDSHQDDVTHLRFHPQNPNLLCSGSTDGLINIFNIQKTAEDDALSMTFNTASSVHKLNWHKNIFQKDIISCITHTNDLKLYECEEGNLIVEFERAKITESIKRKAVANCNLIDCHNVLGGEMFILTGSNRNKGEIMRSLFVQNNRLLPGADFQGNKQILRESVVDLNSNVLITAGESSIVTLWKQQITMNSVPSNLKIAKKKLIKVKPY